MQRSAEIQKAIFERLTNDAALMATIIGVYDDVPQDVRQFPYVVLGDVATNEFDTQTYTGTDEFYLIHVWSTYSGKVQIKIIMQLIYDALHRQPLTLDSGTNWELLFEFQDDFVEPDGETRHGVQRYKLMTVR